MAAKPASWEGSAEITLAAHFFTVREALLKLAIRYLIYRENTLLSWDAKSHDITALVHWRYDG